MIRTYSPLEMREVVTKSVNEAQSGSPVSLPSGLPLYARPMTDVSPKGVSDRSKFMIDTGTRNVTADGRLVLSDNTDGAKMRVLHLPVAEGTPPRTMMPNQGWFANREEQPELEGWLRPVASALVRIAASDAMGHTGATGELKQTKTVGNLGPLSNWLIARAVNEETITDDAASAHFVEMSSGQDAENAGSRLATVRLLVARAAKGFADLA